MDIKRWPIKGIEHVSDTAYVKLISSWVYVKQTVRVCVSVKLMRLCVCAAICISSWFDIGILNVSDIASLLSFEPIIRCWLKSFFKTHLSVGTRKHGWIQRWGEEGVDPNPLENHKWIWL